MGLSRQQRDDIDAWVRRFDWSGPDALTLYAVWADGATGRPVESDGGLILCSNDGTGRDVRLDGTGGITLPGCPWDRPGFLGWSDAPDGGMLTAPGRTVLVPAAADYGSGLRMRVAALPEVRVMAADECRRIVPNDVDGRVYDYILPRLTEKITGVQVASKESQWNHGNLWDPTAGHSFCGWLRQLTPAMIKGCARRVLHRRGRDFTSFEREDGSNPISDMPASTPGRSELPDDLTLVRPTADVRNLIQRDARRLTHGDDRMEGVRVIKGLLKGHGLWSPGLEALDDDLAVSAVMGPAPRDPASRRRFLPTLGDDPQARELCDLWWTGQQRRLTPAESKRLDDLLGGEARTLGVTRWNLLGRLSVAVARMIV